MQNEKAAHFSALVRCSVEEAEQWLSRSCGSMEAALDEYLTRQRSLKRQKASSDSPHPEGLAEFASRRGEEITQNQLKARTAKAEAFSKRNMNSALISGAATSPEAATRSQVVVIDLADETEDEEATAADEPLRRSPSTSPGEVLFLSEMQWEMERNRNKIHLLFADPVLMICLRLLVGIFCPMLLKCPIC